MKKITITTSLLSILLLILTPSISAIQCATLIETNVTQRIQHIQNIERKELKVKRSAINLLYLSYLLKTILASEKLQKIKELLENHLQNAIDKFLRILLLCTLIMYAITYVIGKPLANILEIIVYLLTEGKRELPYVTYVLLLPSEFFFWIMIIIYEIGMNICDWPVPGDPDGHKITQILKDKLFLKNRRSYFSNICWTIHSGLNGI